MSQIENAVLGNLIRNNLLLSLAASRSVTEASFSQPQNRVIFLAMLRLMERDGSFDLVTLATELPDLMLTLAELDSQTVTDANFTTHLDVLKRQEAARDLDRAADEAKKRLAENADTRSVAAELAEASGKAIASIDGAKIPELSDLSAGLDEVLDNPTPCIPFFPIGTEGRYRLQFHPGEMMVIGGGTGLGKTALACSAAVCQIEENLKIAYFCTESSGVDILARLVAASSNVSHFAVSANRKHRDFDKLCSFKAAKNRLMEQHSRQIFIFGCDAGRITPEFIESRLTIAENRAGKIDVVYIDFIQGVKPSKSMEKQQRAMQLEDTVGKIHDTLINHRSAGVVLSQFNRTGTQQKNEYPDLSWLKDSSSLEQLAHTVAFLYRKREDAISYAEETEFYSAKTRNQPPFAITLDWSGTGYLSRHPQFQEQK